MLCVIVLNVGMLSVIKHNVVVVGDNLLEQLTTNYLYFYEKQSKLKILDICGLQFI